MEKEPHSDGEKPVEQSDEYLISMMHDLYRNVSPLSPEHSALIHLLHLERAKHRALEGHKKIIKGVSTESTTNPKYKEIYKKEIEELVKEDIKIETLGSLIETSRKEDQRYDSASKTTEFIIKRLERTYMRDGISSPLALVSLALTDINEEIITRGKPHEK